MPEIVAGGVRLWYREAGTGEALVLMHGNAGSAEVWQRVVPLLAGDYRTVAYDRRGFGRSEKSEPGDPSPRGYAAELARLLDVLEIERAHLAGLSFGGMTALQFALDFPDRLKSLVLVGATADRSGRSVEDVLAELDREGWPAVAARLAASWFRSTSDPADIADAHRIALQSSEAMRRATVRALGRFDITGRIAEIRVPTLVMIGAEDRTCPLPMSEAIRDRIAGSRLVVVPDSAHLVPVEQPGACAAAIMGFLRGDAGRQEEVRRAAGGGASGEGGASPP